jgi:hypothetical protein
VAQAGAALAQLDHAFDLACQAGRLSRALQSNRVAATGIVAGQAGGTAARAQRENVHANSARTLELVARGFVNESDDAWQRSAAPTAAAAGLADWTAMISSGGREASSNPEIRTAQLQLEQAQLNRRFATLTAPTLGVVTNLRLAVGQYVAPGTPAMTFIDARGAWITADLRENQLDNVQAGDEVGIVFDAVPGTVFKGRVKASPGAWTSAVPVRGCCRTFRASSRSAHPRACRTRRRARTLARAARIGGRPASSSRRRARQTDGLIASGLLHACLAVLPLPRHGTYVAPRPRRGRSASPCAWPRPPRWPTLSRCGDSRR